MEFHANVGKDVLIQANGKVYARHAITTHFVQVGESYIDLVERYVKPVYQPGDILLRDWKQDQLLALIADNPAGQNRQLTPFVLIREIQQT